MKASIMKKHSTKRIGFAAILIVAVIVIALFTRAPQRSDLYAAIYHESCQRTCWQGIQPGITSVEVFDQYLADNDIQPFTYSSLPYGEELPGPVYVWGFENEDDPPGFIGAMAGVADGVVSTIWIDVRICLADIIADLGTPPGIVLETLTYLPYLDSGLVVEYQGGGPHYRIWLIPDTEEWHLFWGGPLTDWESVADQFLNDCHIQGD